MCASQKVRTLKVMAKSKAMDEDIWLWPKGVSKKWHWWNQLFYLA
jgi:hypothetical protein